MITIDQIIEKYKANNRFDEAYLSALTESLADRDLRIAVIGKMKAGKSTFTNALVFNDEVLPSGVAPTTVTLTEISYSDSNDINSEVEVELLSESDVDILKCKLNDEDKRKSELAKGILDSLNSIPGGYEQYIKKESTTISIPLTELEQYTAAGGKLSGLAKRIKIRKNNDALKGVTIIDTPGFNDPVISRGEITKEALKTVDIILFVHDYLDKYDQDELSILIDQVEFSGVSTLVDIINKIDANEDLSISEWPSYIGKFSKKKEEAISSINSIAIKELLSNSKVTYVSSLMALIGYSVKKSHLSSEEKQRLNIENYQVSEETKDLYIQYQSDFNELHNEDDFVQYSNILSIIDIINKLSSDKSKYLACYPVSSLIGELKRIKSQIEEEISDKQGELNSLELSASEAEKKLKSFDSIFIPLQTLVKNSMLQSMVIKEISASKQNIQTHRSGLLNEEFTEKNYLDVTFGEFGRKRRNLARYHNFICDFDDFIRIEQESLKSRIIIEGESYVRNLAEKLINNQITLNDRDSFMNALLRSLHSILDPITIDVDPNMPSCPLDGDQKQYALYKADFLERYKDSSLDEHLTKFNNASSTLNEDFLESILHEIAMMKANLRASVKYDPNEKAARIKEINVKILKLKNELSMVEEDIVNLFQLKNDNI